MAQSSQACLIALDRQEKGKAELSAIQEVERDFNTKVISIVTLADLISLFGRKTRYG